MHIFERLASGQVRSGLQVGRDLENIAAVNQAVRVLSKLAHSLENELEAVLKLGLVGWKKCMSSGKTVIVLDLLPNDCHSQAVRLSRAIYKRS